MADVPAIAATIGAVGGPAVAAVAILVNARTTRMNLEEQRTATEKQLEQQRAATEKQLEAQGRWHKDQANHDLKKLRAERLQDVQIGLYQRLAKLRAQVEDKATSEASGYPKPNAEWQALSDELEDALSLAALVASDLLVDKFVQAGVLILVLQVDHGVDAKIRPAKEPGGKLLSLCLELKEDLREAVKELGSD